MDEENFDAERSRLQIKKLKEKVKSLVSEVDLSREIRSCDYPKTPKLQLECNIGDNSSDLEAVDGDEFTDINEGDFANEEIWLIDANSNCNISRQPSGDIFNALGLETEEYDGDIGDILREIRLLRNPCSYGMEAKGPNNRNAFIDSRTFTRPKKYASRPPLTSIITNSSDDGRCERLQKRSTILPTQSIINKLEELNRVSNAGTPPGVHGQSNWEEGSQEGLADIENSIVKSQRKSLPASIIDRLQELKRANNSYVSCRTPETGRHLNIVNGNVDDSFELNIAREAKKVTAALDLNVKNPLSTSCGSEIFKSIPEYFSDNDNDSFLNFDEVSSLGDRSQLFMDPTIYSALLREIEQNEIAGGVGYHGGSFSEDDVPLRRLTFGGVELPLNTESKRDLKLSQQPLLEIDERLNETYKVDNDESGSKGNATFSVKKRESNSGEANLTQTLETEKKTSLVDVILQSDIIKSLNPNYSNKFSDNRNGNGSDGEGIANNAPKNFNETYAQNELNKLHSEKYTTKIFDASFKKSSTSDKSNGKKDSDHSEDDCMSTTSDNSYRSMDSNAELKNIEELENIALQQNRKLAEPKFSTPRLRGTHSTNSDQWKDISPIRKDMADGESLGSSNASSRGASPTRAYLPSAAETSRRGRSFPQKQPLKVAQRELKLKPALIRPLENFKRAVNNGRTSTECKTSVSAGGMPGVKQSVTPVTAVSSTTSTRPVTKIPSGIPRPSSRLKQPQIRVSQVYKK